MFSLLLQRINSVSFTENYALKFEGNGILSLGRYQELDNLEKFTFQFWLCPSEWKSGAHVFEKGDAIRLSLGQEQQLNLHVDGKDFTFTSAELKVNTWVHITLMNGNGSLIFMINNQQIQTINENIKIPVDERAFYIGLGFVGRIDEFRIWGNTLSGDYDNFWQNTLNEFNPQWNDLLGYWKFDQYTCPNIVDYKGNHHGTLSTSGVSREKVTDNNLFRYMVAAAYTDFIRFSDRAIDIQKFQLANYLLILSGKTSETGHAWLPFPFNNATLENAEYVESFEGRSGVAHFKGQGAKMNGGVEPLPVGTFAFGTWLYIENWVENAIIIKKYLDENKGLQIKLGSSDEKKIIVHINGHDYTIKNKIDVKKWYFLGVSTQQTAQDALHQVLFAVNDWTGNADEGPSGEAIQGLTNFTGLENTEVILAENFDGYLDEVAITDEFYDENKLKDMQNGMTMSYFSKTMVVTTLMKYDSYWKFDKKDDLGYDWFSWKEFIRIIKEAYIGRRGANVIMSFGGFENWNTKLADQNIREKLGTELANIANTHDDFCGIDLDFEWPYSAEEWSYYADLVKRTKTKMNPDKTLSITPHTWFYQFPKDHIQYVDRFLFQNYGPNSNEIFTDAHFKKDYDNFINYGHTNDKIIMSWATTTTDGVNGTQKKPPVGIRNLITPSFTRETFVVNKDGYDYHFNSYNSVYFRANYMRQKGATGIFHWDMGNDVNTSHEFSYAKVSSFAINSNVDLIVDKVENPPPAPSPEPTMSPLPTQSPAPTPEQSPLPSQSPSPEQTPAATNTPEHDSKLENVK
ncbi:hypothetical protein TVAG_013990 [Trichomonas vaginalis G3]|uniref:GH18 domain-containing protein n=1 Tax=Trichomonas vaginalis (strain ATCC PRA-98 / G3) TaxID=412133 RepID=A2DDF3_TRIV3|nr:concanavalin A-like lectin/glucanases superfamily [Trichomonas vaginalis G3]EAY21632.1 hypothetical protein TVAG_013990 [Trichomonas vaginalis G3]KAI5489692.1 concanavalin A-like lectin/glucanases superfamily [Trichomonas vaginalis G3]|eukprot:XP_001582618.1 hypothetical protein [Trichomonas vaginalis G3]